jgi:hypothetical protein
LLPEVATRGIFPSQLAAARRPCFDAHGRGRYASPMSALAIKQISWAEKLRTMEELWVSLSQDESRLASPPWHQDALRETTVRYEAGQEQPVDWDAAKRELRKRAE